MCSFSLFSPRLFRPSVLQPLFTASRSPRQVLQTRPTLRLLGKLSLHCDRTSSHPRPHTSLFETPRSGVSIHPSINQPVKQPTKNFNPPSQPLPLPPLNLRIRHLLRLGIPFRRILIFGQLSTFRVCGRRVAISLLRLAGC